MLHSMPVEFMGSFQLQLQTRIGARSPHFELEGIAPSMPILYRRHLLGNGASTDDAVTSEGDRFMERENLQMWTRIEATNPPLTPPRRGTAVARPPFCSPPGRGQGWVGS